MTITTVRKALRDKYKSRRWGQTRVEDVHRDQPGGDVPTQLPSSEHPPTEAYYKALKVKKPKRPTKPSAQGSVGTGTDPALFSRAGEPAASAATEAAFVPPPAPREPRVAHQLAPEERKVGAEAPTQVTINPPTEEELAGQGPPAIEARRQALREKYSGKPVKPGSWREPTAGFPPLQESPKEVSPPDIPPLPDAPPGMARMSSTRPGGKWEQPFKQELYEQLLDRGYSDRAAKRIAHLAAKNRGKFQERTTGIPLEHDPLEQDPRAAEKPPLEQTPEYRDVLGEAAKQGEYGTEGGKVELDPEVVPSKQEMVGAAEVARTKDPKLSGAKQGWKQPRPLAPSEAATTINPAVFEEPWASAREIPRMLWHDPSTGQWFEHIHSTGEWLPTEGTEKPSPTKWVKVNPETGLTEEIAPPPPAFPEEKPGSVSYRGPKKKVRESREDILPQALQEAGQSRPIIEQRSAAERAAEAQEAAGDLGQIPGETRQIGGQQGEKTEIFKLDEERDQERKRKLAEQGQEGAEPDLSERGGEFFRRREPKPEDLGASRYAGQKGTAPRSWPVIPHPTYPTLPPDPETGAPEAAWRPIVRVATTGQGTPWEHTWRELYLSGHPDAPEHMPMMLKIRQGRDDGLWYFSARPYHSRDDHDPRERIPKHEWKQKNPLPHELPKDWEKQVKAALEEQGIVEPQETKESMTEAAKKYRQQFGDMRDRLFDRSDKEHWIPLGAMVGAPEYDKGYDEGKVKEYLNNYLKPHGVQLTPEQNTAIDQKIQKTLDELKGPDNTTPDGEEWKPKSDVGVSQINDHLQNKWTPKERDDAKQARQQRIGETEPTKTAKPKWVSMYNPRTGKFEKREVQQKIFRGTSGYHKKQQETQAIRERQAELRQKIKDMRKGAAGLPLIVEGKMHDPKYSAEEFHTPPEAAHPVPMQREDLVTKNSMHQMLFGKDRVARKGGAGSWEPGGTYDPDFNTDIIQGTQNYQLGTSKRLYQDTAAELANDLTVGDAADEARWNAEFTGMTLAEAKKYYEGRKPKASEIWAGPYKQTDFYRYGGGFMLTPFPHYKARQAQKGKEGGLAGKHNAFLKASIEAWLNQSHPDNKHITNREVLEKYYDYKQAHAAEEQVKSGETKEVKKRTRRKRGAGAGFDKDGNPIMATPREKGKKKQSEEGSKRKGTSKKQQDFPEPPGGIDRGLASALIRANPAQREAILKNQTEEDKAKLEQYLQDIKNRGQKPAPKAQAAPATPAQAATPAPAKSKEDATFDYLQMMPEMQEAILGNLKDPEMEARLRQRLADLNKKSLSNARFTRLFSLRAKYKSLV